MRPVLVLLVMLGGPLAADAEPLKVAREPHDTAAGGPTTVAGVTGEGWFARAMIEALPVYPTFWRTGGVVGLATGLEYWSDRGDQGFGWPYEVLVGVRTPGLRIVTGAGVDIVGAVYEHQMDATHLASRAYALANASIDLFGMRAGIDLRVGRHFVLDVPDFNRWQLGISVGYTWPARHGL